LDFLAAFLVSWRGQVLRTGFAGAGIGMKEGLEATLVVAMGPALRFFRVVVA